MANSRARGRQRERERQRRQSDMDKAIHPQMRAMAAREGTQSAPGGGYNLLDVINGLTGSPRGLSRYMAAMPRDPRDDAPFGPLSALAPNALDRPRPDTGRPGPRLTEYPVAWNVPTGDHRLIPWATLREAARSVDIFRACIEARKKDIRGLKWAFAVSEDAINEAYNADPKRGKSDVARELREKWMPEIRRLTEFWADPWKSQGLTFAKWINGVLEEYMTLDAVAIYPETTYGGDLVAFELIDGTTIKPLRDWRGARPVPPFPAYQQILYGFPRGEWTATVSETTDDGKPIIESGYLADQLFYQVENYRSFTPYGFSAVEQALISARLYLKRQGWMLSEYDDGVMPTSLIELPETSNMMPEQRVEWESALNDDLTGQTAARHRAKLLYPGMTAKNLPSADERYKPEFDLFLIKLACMHFGVAPSKLGFSESKGLGSSGFHESQMGASKDAGETPDAFMLTELINSLTKAYLKAPPEIVFGFVDPDTDDQQVVAGITLGEQNSAQRTVNDSRAKIGLPALAIPEADMPYILTGSGPVFLEGSSAPKPMPGQVGPDGKPLPGAAATNAGAANAANGNTPQSGNTASAGPAGGPLDDFLDAKGVTGDLLKWTYNPNQERADDGRFGSGAGHGGSVSGTSGAGRPPMTQVPGGGSGGDKSTELHQRIAHMSDAEIQAAMAHYGTQLSQPGERSYTGQAAILHALAAAHSARNTPKGPAAAKPAKAVDPNAPLSSTKLNAMLGEHSGVHVTNSHGALHVTLPDGMTKASKAALAKLAEYADQHGLTITATLHGDKAHRDALAKAYRKAGYHQVKSGNSITWQRSPKHAHSATKAADGDGPDSAIANTVCDQLSDDYPAEAITWVHGAHWTGPQDVPLDQIDMEDRDSWTASNEPERVSQFAEAIRKGKAKPTVLVKEPSSDLLKIVDGHHRALGAEEAGAALPSYIGTVGSDTGPWDSMHAAQKRNAYDPGDAPVSAPPATGALKSVEADTAKAAELRAYRRFSARGHARPFAWEHHTPSEVAALTGDVTKVGPKGYEHGWIFVGAPGVGHAVFHPHHGHGTITSHEGGKVGVDFGNGKSHTFQAAHREGAAGHFQERAAHEAEAPHTTEGRDYFHFHDYAGATGKPITRTIEPAGNAFRVIDIDHASGSVYPVATYPTLEAAQANIAHGHALTRERGLLTDVQGNFQHDHAVGDIATVATPMADVHAAAVAHDRAAENAALEAQKADDKAREIERKSTRLTLNGKDVVAARKQREAAIAHTRQAQQSAGAASAARAGGATPEDRASLADLGAMIMAAEHEGRHDDAARGYDVQAARASAGESGWTLGKSPSGKWVLSGADGARREFTSRAAAEEFRTGAAATIARIATSNAARARAKTTTKAGDPDPKDEAAPTPPPDHRWPAWAVDAALTAAASAALIAAMNASIDPGGLARKFYEWAAGQTEITARAVLGWLRSIGVRIDLGKAIRDAMTQGYAIGARAAAAVASQGESVRMHEPGFTIAVDWGNWTPGNVDAARLILSADGMTEGLTRLLDATGAEIEQIAAHRLDEVAAVLADGLERGEGPQAIARALRGILNDPNWAMMTAWTETNRAQSAAAIDTYRARNVPAVEWFTAMDQRVCPICDANEAEGPIPIGMAFASGDPHPPAHPRCRCAVLPVDDLDALEAAKGVDIANEGKHYWTKDPRGLAKWTKSAHPWTALYHHLIKFMPPDEAKRTASQWFHDVLGFWPGTKHVGIVPTKV